MFLFIIIFLIFLIFLINNKNKIFNIFLIIILILIQNNYIFKGFNIFFFFFNFKFDWYNLIFLNILIIIRILIIFYSEWYFISEKRKKIFISYLVIFIFFIFIFVSFNSLLWILTRWERIGILSYILINWWKRRNEARIRGQQAVLYNRVGDFFIYLFFIILLNNFSYFNRKRYFYYLFFFIITISILSKSSLFFFHPWLPNAIERPTPVSSLLHSSTIVVARVFLFIRLNYYFNENLIIYLIIIRRITILYRRFCSLGNFDMKKMIAYSTTSQLRFIIIIISLIRSFYGIIFLVFHAFFKSLLFLLSRLFIHESNREQNKYKINIRNSSLSISIYIFSLLGLIGIPFISRYFAKDLILENIWRETLNSLIIIIFFFRCCVTISYSIKLYFLNNKKINLKIISLNFLRKNTIWICYLSFFVIINRVFFIYRYFSEINLYKEIKIIILLIFIIRLVLYYFNYFLKNMLFYNLLKHRKIIIVNKSLQQFLIVLEFKWLEVWSVKRLSLHIFYRFKNLIILLFGLIILILIFLLYSLNKNILFVIINYFF